VPFGAEPGSIALLDALSVHSTVVVPVVLPSRELDWAAWTGADDLVPHDGSRVLRPLGPTLGVDYIVAADLILVPALLVSMSGERLGRGGGSFDRALPRARGGVPFVGLLHDGELVDSLPADPWDVHLTAAVTPGAGWTDLPS
jgi:5-formyltetrahydrofolate cyclo-ligase